MNRDNGAFFFGSGDYVIDVVERDQSWDIFVVPVEVLVGVL